MSLTLLSCLQVTMNNIKGYLPAKITQFLMCLHTGARTTPSSFCSWRGTDVCMQSDNRAKISLSHLCCSPTADFFLAQRVRIRAIIVRPTTQVAIMRVCDHIAVAPAYMTRLGRSEGTLISAQRGRSAFALISYLYSSVRLTLYRLCWHATP